MTEVTVLEKSECTDNNHYLTLRKKKIAAAEQYLSHLPEILSYVKNDVNEGLVESMTYNHPKKQFLVNYYSLPKIVIQF